MPPSAEPLTAGIDVGGTKTLGVAVDSQGGIRASVRTGTVGGDADAVVAGIVRTLRRLARAVAIDPLGFDAVGVGVPGVVDVDAGTVRHAVNLGLDGTPIALAERLADEAGLRPIIENDVNAAAIGVTTALALGDEDDLAYLSIGTGIAAGFVLGGRLRRGRRGTAGEIGHLPLDPAGPVCECGQRGCLEAAASGPAGARRWPSANGVAPAVALLAAARAADADAVAARDEIAEYLAAAVTLLALSVDPDLIVLGGGVAEAGRDLLDAVHVALRRRALGSPLVDATELSGRVQLAPAGVPVGAVGAARLARRAVLGT
ncbi:MAG: ROK family protein [Acidimicrobiales bacterium]